MTERADPSPNSASRRSPTRIDERQRPLPVSPATPQRVVWQLLREQAGAEDAAADEARRQVADVRDVLAQLALDVADVLHRLDVLPPQAPAEDLQPIVGRLHKALAAAGVRYLDPVGEPYADVAAWADVQGSQECPGNDRPVVLETLRPGVLLADGRLAQRARVYLAVPAASGNEQDREPD
ncbi:hypothetical protein OHR68_41785 [Spirillospora sp. NBC_00431]